MLLCLGPQFVVVVVNVDRVVVSPFDFSAIFRRAESVAINAVTQTFSTVVLISPVVI